MSLLSVNRRIGADLIADVIDQSADNLVDGVTAGTYARDFKICGSTKTISNADDIFLTIWKFEFSRYKCLISRVQIYEYLCYIPISFI